MDINAEPGNRMQDRRPTKKILFETSLQREIQEIRMSMRKATRNQQTGDWRPRGTNLESDWNQPGNRSESNWNQPGNSLGST